ncbi:AI-2E family transporter, partial [bacterium]|nr:AI-2E family transporter [bacterium]
MLLIGFYLLISILSVGQGLIVPLILSALIAIVLHPVVKLFVRWKFNRLLAIIVTLLLSFLVIVSFGLFLVSQLSRFSESWPIFVDKFTLLINNTIHWIPGYFDISAQKVNTWIAETKTDLLDGSGLAIGQTLLSVGSGIVVLFLIPVYVFLFLFYKPLLLDFIHKLFADNRQKELGLVVTQTKSVIQSYLIGLIIEIALVALLDTVGLLLLGIEYAVVIGILGALLNLIPYIGSMVAVAIPMMIALVTKDSAWSAFYVLLLYYVVQLIDNNFFVPKIVASKVRINALVSIVAVLAGGALWGIPGMFLSIPIVAIVKVVC